eukprot:s2101_g7.t1
MAVEDMAGAIRAQLDLVEASDWQLEWDVEPEVAGVEEALHFSNEATSRNGDGQEPTEEQALREQNRTLQAEDERGHTAQRKEGKKDKQKSPEDTDENTDQQNSEDRNEAPEKKDEKQEEKTMTKEESSSSSSSADGGGAPEASGTAPKPAPKADIISPTSAIDVQNSLIIVRADAKSAEVRRCRSCHNIRAAINRLIKNHGNLVKDFSKVTGDKLTAFYQDHPHLRVEDLRLKVEELVTDWKTPTTRFEFSQDEEYLDEIDLGKKYADKPDVLQNFLLNSKRFSCLVKKQAMYADPKYTARVQDAVEHGSTEKRKGQSALKEDDAEPQNKRRRTGGGGNASKGASKGASDPQEPKLKAGEKKKITKKVESLAAKNALLKDCLEKAATYADMIPAYVVDAAKTSLNDSHEPGAAAQKAVECGTGDFQALLDSLDAHVEKVGAATARIKAQVESAAAFK